MNKKIKTALISVFHKDGLDEILPELQRLEVKILSTGGTYKFIEDKGIPVSKVEDLTGYPSILDGRVKTLHPKVFGGILAKREEHHLGELAEYDIPEIDLVIVDLYPFEQTVAQTQDENTIIEKIDIGGISLIRAAAKNYKDIVIIPSKKEYRHLLQMLQTHQGESTIEDRKVLARKAFAISSHYDTAIYHYFNLDGAGKDALRISQNGIRPMRYGENPHQTAQFYGNLKDKFTQISGKALSYNNLVDIDAAVDIMSEFANDDPTFAILKHMNACGIATRNTVSAAWRAALAGDPISAFGGILICNKAIDYETAQEIDRIFYEVLIAPDFDDQAEVFLTMKRKRVLLKIKDFAVPSHRMKTILNGVILQQADIKTETAEDLVCKTNLKPTEDQISQLLFANKCAKHLKSNTIALVKNNQLIGMGCGQTSRVDACKQAIDKAKRMKFDVTDAVMASDAFFPFPDCVEIAAGAGVKAVIQPGGSIKDQLSIDACNRLGVSMVFSGARHFKH